METTIITKTVAGILALLSKTIRTDGNDTYVCTIAQFWIDLFSKLDESTQISVSKPEDENRLWFILESQKDEVIAKLSLLGVTADVSAKSSFEADQLNPDDFAQSQAEDDFDNEECGIAEDDPNYTDDVLVTSSPSQSGVVSPALQQVEETSLPVQQPVIASIKTIQEVVSAPQPIVAPAKTIQEVAAPAPAPTKTIPNFFTQSQELAAATFHDKLCNSLEKAFQATNMLSVTHFDAVTAQLQTIEQTLIKELADFEIRMNSKLEAICKTSAISANNTDAMSKMFSAYALENNHSQVFVSK